MFLLIVHLWYSCPWRLLNSLPALIWWTWTCTGKAADLLTKLVLHVKQEASANRSCCSRSSCTCWMELKGGCLRSEVIYRQQLYDIRKQIRDMRHFILITAAQTWQIISQIHRFCCCDGMCQECPFECCFITDRMLSGFIYFSEEEQKLFYTQMSCFASGRRKTFLDLHQWFVAKKLKLSVLEDNSSKLQPQCVRSFQETGG